MFKKVIEFSAHEDYFKLKEDYPIPAKLNIPEWYKELSHSPLDLTIKGCMPFLDTLTSGYLLKMPQDFHIRHNVDNKDADGNIFKDSFSLFALHQLKGFLDAKFLNLNSAPDAHPIKQVGKKCPYVDKNKNLPFYKIINPWKIKTPKGYSCLFVPPLNNSDDRFSIIPGIVDTDTFPNEVNFPIIINGDKYPVLETLIKKGTPYAQVIPFKRDNWKMTFKPTAQSELQKRRIFYSTKLINIYKDKFWSKKSWT
jgi:hypothetical protein